jgi:hypothetical protein
MRWLVLFAVACGSKTSGTADADPATCSASLEAATDRACSVASDCVLVSRTDCCGNIWIAVKKGTEATFAQAEATYATCLACGDRGCFHPDAAEDGGIPKANQSIVATCAAQRCLATVQ